MCCRRVDRLFRPLKFIYSVAMNLAMVFSVILVALAAANWVQWIWIDTAQVEEGIQSFVEFDGLHLNTDAFPQTASGEAPCHTTG